MSSDELMMITQLRQSLSDAVTSRRDGATSLQIESILAPFEEVFASGVGCNPCALVVLQQLESLDHMIVFLLADMAVQETFSPSAVEVVIHAYSVLERGQRLLDRKSEKLASYLEAIETSSRVAWADEHVVCASALLNKSNESLAFSVLRLLVLWQRQSGYLPAPVIDRMRSFGVSPRCDDLVNRALNFTSGSS